MKLCVFGTELWTGTFFPACDKDGEQRGLVIRAGAKLPVPHQPSSLCTPFPPVCPSAGPACLPQQPGVHLSVVWSFQSRQMCEWMPRIYFQGEHTVRMPVCSHIQEGVERLVGDPSCLLLVLHSFCSRCGTSPDVCSHMNR